MMPPSISSLSLLLVLYVFFHFLRTCHAFTTTTTTTTASLSNIGSSTSSFGMNHNLERRRLQVEQQRKDWIDRSVSYYSKVMREERRKQMGQINTKEQSSYQDDEFHQLAKKHYFALQKIRDGQHRHAEVIYRRIIDELMKEEQEDHKCDHAKLAVTTLLLALHLQRMGNIRKARSVFLNFFRIAVVENDHEHEECACSAKVLGAYALFEMKQGNSIKSLEIAKRAVQFDPTNMAPVLQWRQFREVGRGF